jgi:hypothetical protein
VPDANDRPLIAAAPEPGDARAEADGNRTRQGRLNRPSPVLKTGGPTREPDASRVRPRVASAARGLRCRRRTGPPASVVVRYRSAVIQALRDTVTSSAEGRSEPAEEPGSVWRLRWTGRLPRRHVAEAGGGDMPLVRC